MRARDDARHRRHWIHLFYISQLSQFNPSFYRHLHHALQYLLLLLQTRIVDCTEPPYPEPQFLPRPLNVTAREGSKVVLPCAVLYLGTKQVTWRRIDENHFLSIGDLTWIKDPNLEIKFHEQTPEVTEWNLVIKKATSQHSGTYECQISDKVKLTRYVHLQVVGPPVVESATIPAIALSGKNYVERGQAIHLYCNTSGSDGSHLNIDWFKDGDKIDHTNYKHVVITSYNMVEPNVGVSELLIDRSNPSDTGTYICRSASGYIDSTRVTVLFADSSNVKRGNPSSKSAESRPQCLLVASVFVATIVHICLHLTSASHWQYCQ